MKVELFPFQKKALAGLRMQSAEALGSYRRTHSPQVVSFTAPTGAGKTIIMASLIESIYFGDDSYPDQQNAIFVWLSDSPQLNEQSKQKIDLKADKIRLDQCITITEETFDREVLDDGHIYFLNTQKLGKSSNLTKHSDTRQYTIWETLANTAREKSDRLYLIIDEAHRGMQGREASKATTIMQKFLKGSTEDKLAPMPVVIGMSATSERFNRLVEGTSSTIHKVVVTADEVRASGLLKDRIVITYPEESSLNKDMAVLQAAADDWKEKWDHWTQYCREQHYAYVNPVFVVQVLSSTGDRISDTDLDDCLRKIEERTGFHFSEGEVVHTFGQTSASITVNGINVRYEEPSRIAEDRNIKVVFFKENLSTGWDCPRAETMMSFRHAKDATYIAQLLGRMVRTPMQTRILVDEILNDVHLYLPYFDNYSIHDLFTTTDTDIDRQFRLAETKLGSEGVANEYGRQYFDVDEPNAYKIDVIIFAADDECIKSLHTYAEAKFHNLNDTYRRYIARIDSDRFRRQYDSIVSDGDIVSKHNFRLPETIQVAHEDGGKEYSNHLFVNANTGTAVMKLNGWEEGVIAEEEKNPDFVCWLRNPSRKSWSLCIPYEMDNETKPAYPDFIIVRKDAISGYVIDILEPHNPEYIDNLGKAKGFAEYARQNPGVGRIQLIRMAKDISGKNRFKRLDMSMSAVRDKVSRAINNDELDHIFDTDGFFM